MRTHANLRWALLSLALLALTAFASPAFAQNVRGQLVFQNSAPFAGAKVRICGPNFCTPLAVSGIDGMYYLYEVPAGGPYNLEVYVDAEQPRTVVQVSVNGEWTDVAQIIL